jgi:hypothetical protein
MMPIGSRRQRRRKYLAEVNPLLISPRRAGMAALRHSLKLTGNECRVPVVASIEDLKQIAHGLSAQRREAEIIEHE